MLCSSCSSRESENHRKLCSRCIYLNKKSKDLYRWSFGVHRRNARRRNIPWHLSFDEFKEFAIKFDLMVRAGRKKESLHIDRIDVNKGYVAGNIQVLSNSENIKKRYIHDYCSGSGKYILDVITPEEDLPF